MIRVKTINYDKPGLVTHSWTVIDQALENFINQVGYDNVKQILIYGATSSPRYTVIYEE